jgi:NAD(P)-dependent dehydrogenase (short-subunit alcohol dehydrogenase family)
MNRYTQPGCVAIVTGAASGLGKGLADAYAARGLQVVYADINEAGVRAAAAAAGPRCEAAGLDVADPQACTALIADVVARKGRLDLMFNCAGYAVMGEVQDTSLDDWRRIVDVNLMGSVHCAVQAYKQMARQGGGQIATIASLAGLTPMPLGASYATTKAALVHFSHTLRCEGHGLGIGVSVICPSFIDTNIFNHAQYRNSDQQSARSLIPMKFLSVDQAVRSMLAGVDANRATIVFPFHAKLLWWLQRLLQQSPNPVTDRVMVRVRAGKAR